MSEVEQFYSQPDMLETSHIFKHFIKN
jgi:hypothetical protein